MRDFLPTPELNLEFEAFKALKTDEERRAFQEERKAKVATMTPPEREAYLAASEAGLKATIKGSKAFIEKANDLFLKEKLGEIPEAISLSYVAKKYFGKSRNWLYQRLNGNLVNGKPACFTSAEREQFLAALEDISNMIKKTSLSLS